MDAFGVWLQSTRVSMFMAHSAFAWPICACLHFLGLSLLIGTVGLFDLRLVGFARGLSPAAMHRLIPWGVGGFVVNLITGTLFVIGQPFRYIHNPAFQLKLAFIAVLGINMLVFYASAYRKVAMLGPDEATPVGAKIAGATSLILWVGVICAGRMVAFFLP
jgi:hypothetical protein